MRPAIGRSPFVKIMQRFILMKNTFKKDLRRGGEIFGAFFFKSSLIGQYRTLPKFSRLKV